MEQNEKESILAEAKRERIVIFCEIGTILGGISGILCFIIAWCTVGDPRSSMAVQMMFCTQSIILFILMFSCIIIRVLNKTKTWK